MCVRLFTDHGVLIHQQTVISQAVLPEIIVWKGRYFKQAFAQANESFVRYSEVSIFLLDDDPE